MLDNYLNLAWRSLTRDKILRHRYFGPGDRHRNQFAHPAAMQDERERTIRNGKVEEIGFMGWLEKRII